MQLDHLAVVCRDLATGTAFVEEALGVTMEPGGKHARFGTHNRLLSLGPGEYLEVIAPDPDAAPFEGPRWFGLDDAPEGPRLGNWICRCDSLARLLPGLPAALGPALPLQRGDLSWQLTVPPDGSLPFGGGWPTLIEWGAGAHPASRLRDQGVRLTGLTLHHPDASALSKDLSPLLNDPRIQHRSGPLALSAMFDTPDGPRGL